MSRFRNILSLLVVMELLWVAIPETSVCYAAQSTTTRNTKKESINNLKNQKNKLKNDINKTDQKLTDTRRSTKQSLQELERLNEDIVYRDMLIDRRSNEISDFTCQIDSLNRNIKSLSIEYEDMRKKFADMIYYAYITKSQQDKLLYILASKSFQEGYRRFQYLTSLAEMRKEQSVALQKTKHDIELKCQKMNLLKAKTEELLKKQEQEKEFSLQQKQRQNKLVESLRSKEKELKEELRKQQNDVDNLNRKIQDMIAKQAAEEAARQRKLKQQQLKKAQQQTASKTGSKQNTTKQPQKNTVNKNTAQNTSTLTAEEKVIDGGFAKNKGLLMWPVKGIITGRFGQQKHPVLKDVTINNKGIYISAAAGSKAVAIYDGFVSQCFSVPGGNNAVIVRHGNYLTVYANLTQIYVKNGQKIKRNTPIGKIYQETDNHNKTTLFFQIWKEKTLLNPQQWLHK